MLSMTKMMLLRSTLTAKRTLILKMRLLRIGGADILELWELKL